MSVDLNKLRSTLEESQRRNDTLPDDPSRQVVIDREGNIILGGDSGTVTGRTLVPQDIFAGIRP